VDLKIYLTFCSLVDLGVFLGSVLTFSFRTYFTVQIFILCSRRAHLSVTNSVISLEDFQILETPVLSF
jgi:hypothetical protein